MENFKLTNDVPLLCSRVTTFPEGIREAFESLAHDLPACEGRNYYGISFIDDQGRIIYKVAARQITEAGSRLNGYEPLTLFKGNYLAQSLKNWRAHLSDISTIFGEMMDDPRVDKSSPCVEWYRSEEEMLYMMKEADSQ